MEITEEYHVEKCGHCEELQDLYVAYRIHRQAAQKGRVGVVTITRKCIECGSCESQGPPVDNASTVEEVIEAWNLREGD